MAFKRKKKPIIFHKNDHHVHRVLYGAGMTVTYDWDGTNGTVAVLEGAVAVRNSWGGGGDGGKAVRLVSGEAIDVFGQHAVTTVSATPSCYVYAVIVDGTDDSADDAHEPTAVRARPGCSDACYAFALDAVKSAFSALLPASR